MTATNKTCLIGKYDMKAIITALESQGFQVEKRDMVVDYRTTYGYLILRKGGNPTVARKKYYTKLFITLDSDIHEGLAERVWENDIIHVLDDDDAAKKMFHESYFPTFMKHQVAIIKTAHNEKANDVITYLAKEFGGYTKIEGKTTLYPGDYKYRSADTVPSEPLALEIASHINNGVAGEYLASVSEKLSEEFKEYHKKFEIDPNAPTKETLDTVE